jgi:LmbE family N-acetylglucosaminyl deacetylase
MTRREMLSAAGVALGLPLAEQAGGADGQNEKLKVIVAGGHPDDPETGCGGTMAHYSALGHEVIALYLTRGEAGISGKSHEDAARIRTQEAEDACKILGARALFAGQIDGDTEVGRAWYEKFRKLMAAEQPDIVFVHWPIDTHPDHRAASMLVYDAWQAARKKFSLYYYEVMTGSQTQNFLPTHYVNIEATEEKKRRASYAHRSQNPDAMWAHHDAMDRFRGMECHAKFAEAFVRYVRSPEPGLSALGAAH